MAVKRKVGHRLSSEYPKMPEGSALGIRFANEESGLKSASIYDLGLSLIAIQRIVHKADLDRKDRLRWGAKLPAATRRELALTEIGDRDR
jgi:hypothetical protein